MLVNLEVISEEVIPEKAIPEAAAEERGESDPEDLLGTYFFLDSLSASSIFGQCHIR